MRKHDKKIQIIRINKIWLAYHCIFYSIKSNSYVVTLKCIHNQEGDQYELSNFTFEGWDHMHNQLIRRRGMPRSAPASHHSAKFNRLEL